MATSMHRWRRLVYILLALLTPVLLVGLSARRLEAIAAAASSSEHEADGDSVPQDDQDPAGVQHLAAVATCAPVPPRAAGHPSFRLPVGPVSASSPVSVWTPSRLSTCVTPLRC